MVTQDEASTLAHATFGPGKEEALTGGSKECVYGYQTTNVMDIIVAQAATPAAASAAYAEGLGRTQTIITSGLPAGIQIKLNTANTAGIGDKATTGTGVETLLGKPISFIGIYVISGANFLTIGDLVVGATAPTVAAVQDQAQVSLGRI